MNNDGFFYYGLLYIAIVYNDTVPSFFIINF